MTLSKSLILASAALMLSTPFAMAQDTPDHPRENEVNQRLENQQDRVDSGVNKGQINAKQATRDSKRDARVARQEIKDEAKHNGHLTKKEQKHMNKELNKNSTDIKDQRTN
jgi:hypothetical protein